MTTHDTNARPQSGTAGRATATTVRTAATLRTVARPTLSAVVTAALALAGTVTLSGTAQAAGTPVAPDGGAVYLSSGTADTTQLYVGEQSRTTLAFSPLGDPTPTGEAHQGLAFRASDRMFYAVEAYQGFHLLKIDGEGAVEKLGVLADIAGGPYIVAGGTFGQGALADTYLTIVMDRSGAYTPSHLLGLEIAADGTFTETRIPLSLPSYAVLGDVAASGGYLWGIYGQEIFRIDPTDGSSTAWTLPEGSVEPGTTTTFGAAWAFGDGRLSFGSSLTGQITQIEVGAPASAEPAFTVTARHTAPTTRQNDATYAPAAGPVDLEAVAAGPATVEPGAVVTTTITVTNRSGYTSSGAMVEVVLPEGLTDVVLPEECHTEGDRILCSVGALAPGASASFDLTGTAPTTAQDLAGTVTVRGNDVDDVASNDTGSFVTAVELPAAPVPEDPETPELPEVPETPETPEVSEPPVDSAPAPDAPGIDPTDGSQVTGTGVPGHTITVTFPGGSTAQTTVGADGAWSVPTTDVPLQHGDLVEATATDAAGAVSEPACTTVDLVAPEEPVLEPSDGTEIGGGVVEPGDTVTVVDDGKPLPGEVVVDEEGHFVLTPETPLTPEGDAQVIVTDPAGNTSAPVDVVVTTDASAPDRTGGGSVSSRAAGAGTASGAGGAAGRPAGPLATTGGDQLASTITALALAGLGTALVVRRRRRSARD